MIRSVTTSMMHALLRQLTADAGQVCPRPRDERDIELLALRPSPACGTRKADRAMRPGVFVDLAAADGSSPDPSCVEIDGSRRRVRRSLVEGLMRPVFVVVPDV